MGRRTIIGDGGVRRELEAIMAAEWPEMEDTAKLARLLYERCYNHSILDPPPAPAAAGPDLLDSLMAANQSRPTWDEGWRLDQPLDDGRVLARKGGAARTFLPGEFITDRGPDRGPEPDTPINVFTAPGSADLQGAFYFAFGESVEELGVGTGTLRIYWNIAPEGAADLMRALTREFNRFQVAFRFKCLRKVADYTRRDAAILYVSRRSYPIVAMLIEKLHASVRQWLRDGVPLFTKHVARGLGFAEDPGDSFGAHRTRILAEAVAVSRGRAVEERLEELRRQFASRGISLDTPWLGANSPETYPFPFPAA
jgi:hypothetical protein